MYCTTISYWPMGMLHMVRTKHTYPLVNWVIFKTKTYGGKKKKNTCSDELQTSLNIIQSEKDSAWLEQQFLSIFSLMTYAKSRYTHLLKHSQNFMHFMHKQLLSFAIQSNNKRLHAISLYTLVKTFPKLHALHAQTTSFLCHTIKYQRVHTRRRLVVLLVQFNEETESCSGLGVLHTSILSSAGCWTNSANSL